MLRLNKIVCNHHIYYVFFINDYRFYEKNIVCRYSNTNLNRTLKRNNFWKQLSQLPTWLLKSEVDPKKFLLGLCFWNPIIFFCFTLFSRYKPRACRIKVFFLPKRVFKRVVTNRIEGLEEWKKGALFLMRKILKVPLLATSFI
jgi:adenine-specific DNA methylase